MDQLAVSFVSDLTNCQGELGLKKLGQEALEPHSEVLVTLDNLPHQVGLLQAGREKIIAAGLVAKGTVPRLNIALLNIKLSGSYLSV